MEEIIQLINELRAQSGPNLMFSDLQKIEEEIEVGQKLLERYMQQDYPEIHASWKLKLALLHIKKSLFLGINPSIREIHSLID